MTGKRTNPLHTNPLFYQRLSELFNTDLDLIYKKIILLILSRNQTFLIFTKTYIKVYFERYEEMTFTGQIT